MLTYHNKQEIKDKYVTQMIQHRKADQLIKGKYWEDGKGCMIGCLVHSSSHEQVEKEVGIPLWLAHLSDFIFENLPNGISVKFPERLLNAVPVGVDLAIAKHKFFLFLLEEICENTDYELVKNPIEDIKKLHIDATKGNMPDRAAWSAAESAWSAAWTAASSAAWSAAESARSAAWSASSAASSAAWSAASSAAESAWSAAWTAASSAAWTAASSAAWTAAWTAAVEKMADKIIEILEQSDGESETEDCEA